MNYDMLNSTFVKNGELELQYLFSGGQYLRENCFEFLNNFKQRW